MKKNNFIVTTFLSSSNLRNNVFFKAISLFLLLAVLAYVIALSENGFLGGFIIFFILTVFIFLYFPFMGISYEKVYKIVVKDNSRDLVEITQDSEGNYLIEINDKDKVKIKE